MYVYASLESFISYKYKKYIYRLTTTFSGNVTTQISDRKSESGESSSEQCTQ